jgi:sugar (pentulose or hexulose) kinase
MPYLPPAEAGQQAHRVTAALAAGHSAGAIYAAVVRGSAGALAARLGEARAEGCDPRDFVATGGFTRSPFVLEVVSRTLGVPLPVAPDEAAARGAAACAAVATGWFADAEAAVEGGW